MKGHSATSAVIYSSQRYKLAPAPGDLAIVQGFINTAAAGRTVRGTDLLATTGEANAWLAALPAGALPGPAAVKPADLAELRRLRGAISGFLSRQDTAGDKPQAFPPVRADLTLDADGVEVRPAGPGWKLLAGLMLRILYDAQLTGELRRLKICPNEWCLVAFYDRSKNNSAIWHNSATCGNIVNVRASRARRRRGSEPAPDRH
jgi:predicted RNA-binding Zn ribbon-like protein